MPTGVYKHKKNQGFQKGHIDISNNKGRKRTPKQIEKYRYAMFKRWKNKEYRERMVDIHMGKNFSNDTKIKMSLSHSGNKSHLWKGGKSKEKYGIGWIPTLKRSIRERDRYVCRLCGKQQEDRAHDVHHIDYNKENNNPNNLITLCKYCHMKTNFNREYYNNLLNNLI